MAVGTSGTPADTDPLDAGRADRDGAVGQRALQEVALAAVSDAVDDDRAYVEPEAEREHRATVAPALGCEQERLAGCYFAGEEEAGARR